MSNPWSKAYVISSRATLARKVFGLMTEIDSCVDLIIIVIPPIFSYFDCIVVLEQQWGKARDIFGWTVSRPESRDGHNRLLLWMALRVHPPRTILLAACPHIYQCEHHRPSGKSDPGQSLDPIQWIHQQFVVLHPGRKPTPGNWLDWPMVLTSLPWRWHPHAQWASAGMRYWCGVGIFDLG